LVVCFLGSVVLLYFFAPDFTPKRNLLFILGAFTILFLIYRSIINNYLKTQKRINLVLIGNSKIEEKVKNFLLNNKQYNYHIKYHFPSFEENISQIKNLIIQENIDLVVYTKDVKEVNKILFPFINKKIESIDLATFYMDVFKKIPLEEIDEEWILNHFEHKEFYEALKRCFDIFIGILFFLTFILTFPLVALLIKLESKGPVIYKQKRSGKDQKQFSMYKYRTMYQGSDLISPFTTKKDTRITKIGKILRKIHIDEVPQAINLLKGEVSLVGPRPEVTSIDYQACDQIDYYIVKHKIRPGITGWAQTHFGYTDKIEEYKEKFEYDLYYLINRSFALDVLIILQTIRAPFETKTY